MRASWLAMLASGCLGGGCGTIVYPPIKAPKSYVGYDKEKIETATKLRRKMDEDYQQRLQSAQKSDGMLRVSQSKTNHLTRGPSNP